RRPGVEVRERREPDLPALERPAEALELEEARRLGGPRLQRLRQLRIGVEAVVADRLQELDGVQLVDERLGVEGLVVEPRGDLLARGPRALEEEPVQELARLGAPPPVLADLADEVGAELRRADPGA